MGQTLLDYVRKNKLPLTASYPNELDFAVFALLSYLPWDQVVPPYCSLKMISLKEAISLFQQQDHPTYTTPFRAQLDQKLLQILINNPRFSHVFLSNYQNHIDYEAEQQFSAIVFSIGPDQHVVAFRGTDDSLAGWKEDFNLSFQTPVASQQEAVSYFESVATHLNGTFSLVGHSKGGNLAVYAASFTKNDLQKQISNIINFDGPGFLKEIIETKEYQMVQKQITTFLPQSSIVGMLLEHAEPYVVVHSYQIGLWQHDLYSWEVDQEHFVTLKQVTNTSLFFNQTIHEWLSQLTLAEREQFVDTLYQIFRKTGVNTTEDFNAHWFAHTKTFIRELTSLSSDNKALLLKTIGALFEIGKKNVLLSFQKDQKS